MGVAGVEVIFVGGEDEAGEGFVRAKGSLVCLVLGAFLFGGEAV